MMPGATERFPGLLQYVARLLERLDLLSISDGLPVDEAFEHSHNARGRDEDEVKPTPHLSKPLKSPAGTAGDYLAAISSELFKPHEISVDTIFLPR